MRPVWKGTPTCNRDGGGWGVVSVSEVLGIEQYQNAGRELKNECLV